MNNKKHISSNMSQIYTMDVEQDIRSALDFANLLTRHKIRGEFYITGQMLEKYPKQVKQIAKRHIICAHGYHHEDFTCVSYKDADRIIKKTVELFKKHKLKLIGWRFPGFKFKNSQLKILVKYGLFDSSIRDVAMQRWKSILHIRNFLSNMKRRRVFLPVRFPKNLDERPWSKIDLNDSRLYLKQGRLVFHCYNYKKIKNEFENYLNELPNRSKLRGISYINN
ncbi:polysaccharide deacetylase family protein [Candidatus Woesearchaeota archaeon]|nr:polysaccharide deacetylase family protein [Candidatus Woesearchaeota archaeon]